MAEKVKVAKVSDCHPGKMIEINAKGKHARFKKMDRGLFAKNG